MPVGVTDSEPITFEMPPITEAQLDAFRRATCTDPALVVPPTFATLFRRAEFDWVDRLETKVQSVLHAEQEYQYVSGLKPGDRPVITTSLKNLKGRGGMLFLVLESVVTCDGETRMLCSTTFVVREAKEPA